MKEWMDISITIQTEGVATEKDIDLIFENAELSDYRFQRKQDDLHISNPKKNFNLFLASDFLESAELILGDLVLSGATNAIRIPLEDFIERYKKSRKYT